MKSNLLLCTFLLLVLAVSARADSYQTTVIWDYSGTSTGFSVVTNSIPADGPFTNPSFFCGQSGYPACIVNVISPPVCHEGVECGEFAFNDGATQDIVTAEFNNTFQYYSFTAYVAPMTAPGIYDFDGTLNYQDPITNTTTDITGYATVVDLTTTITPEPSEFWPVLVGALLLGSKVIRARLR